MAEWTEWKELEGTSLYSAVPHEFAGEWDWHEVDREGRTEGRPEG